jgi:hypothetical protein
VDKTWISQVDYESWTTIEATRMNAKKFQAAFSYLVATPSKLFDPVDELLNQISSFVQMFVIVPWLCSINQFCPHDLA